MNENNDLDFVDKLMKKAYNFEAPACPEFKDETKVSFVKKFMNIFNKKASSEGLTELNDSFLDSMCGAGSNDGKDAETQEIEKHINEEPKDDNK